MSLAVSEPSPEAVRKQLDRILSSKLFANSEQLSRFLRFAVEQAIESPSEPLKEYLIGVEVFGRRESFDPRTDAIVRVQAVNLRERLKQFYAHEGAGDPVVITFVKGGYCPAFRYRKNGSEAVEPASIAVLPFVNMSSDPENEYFVEGLTEELISALSNVPGVRVVARTSVFRFKGKADDVRKIGAELNARMVLEGSVRKSGKRLRITAQLVDASNGYESWSRTYRVEMQDLFTVQEEIARAIAISLGGRLSGQLPRPTNNLEAFHSHLKGRFNLNKWTEDGFAKSIGFFEAAIAEDPQFAPAYAGLADALFVHACYGKQAPHQIMPRARQAAEKALELNPSLAEAHVSLGAVRAIYDWDWNGSEREFLMAADLDPDCAAAYQWYGILCLMPQGRLQEAAVAVQRARDLDPLSAPINTALGLVLMVEGNTDEATSQFQKALEVDPGFSLAYWWLGAIYLSRSMVMKAFAAFRKSGAFSSKDAYSQSHFTYGERLVGRGGKARRILQDLVRGGREHYVSPTMVATMHVVLGDTAAAFEWLDRAYEARDAWLPWLGVDRRFDPIRGNPRFKALIKRIGISGSAPKRPRASDLPVNS